MPLTFWRRSEAETRADREKTAQSLKKTRDSWFGRLANVFAQPDFDTSLWEDLEEALIGADVGIELSEEILERTKDRTREEWLKKGALVRDTLKEEMAVLLNGDNTSSSPSSEDRIVTPAILLIIGVNGSGKTTTVAKLAQHEQRAGRRVLLAAADTFRAAAIDQLRIWGQRLGIDVIAHQPGADPGAVVFDAVQAARNRDVDTLIVDTAGRLHTKSNLMGELKKVRRVIDRTLPSADVTTLLVLDATTGQNGLAQARAFTEAIGVDGAVLAKLDGTAKGGFVFAIRRELGIPIAYIGTGEDMEDLAPFDSKAFVEALFS